MSAVLNRSCCRSVQRWASTALHLTKFLCHHILTSSYVANMVNLLSVKQADWMRSSKETRNFISTRTKQAATRMSPLAYVKPREACSILRCSLCSFRPLSALQSNVSTASLGLVCSLTHMNVGEVIRSPANGVALIHWCTSGSDAPRNNVLTKEMKKTAGVRGCKQWRFKT